MNQVTLAQRLRASVTLVQPELLAQVPSDYGPRQTFNFLRHRATNYDVLLEAHRARYGSVSPAEVKALTQGAADAIINAFRAENVELIRGRANTPFARFARSLVQLLGLDSGVDLQAIHEATVTLKRSQVMYRSWNERYRRQRDLVLAVVRSADPQVRRRVEAVYRANSKVKLDQLEASLFQESGLDE
jgi:hypothetical protein